MIHYNNCKSYASGIFKPHTLQIKNRNISIEYGDCLPYYIKKGFLPIATATDTRGYHYTVYADDNDGIIAIPHNK